MSGGLLQIAVYGTQDIFLTGTPQVTFFKMVYRRHTNFAMESIRQVFEGYADFGNKLSCVIDKVGDLLYKIYIEIELPSVDLVKHPEHFLLSEEVAKLEYEKSLAMFNEVYKYLVIDTDYIRKLDVLLKTNNVSMADIEALFDSSFIDPLIVARDKLILYIKENIRFIHTLAPKENDLLYQINRIDIKIVFDSVILTLDRIFFGTDPAVLAQTKKKELLNIIENQIYKEIQDFFNTFNEDKTKKEQVYQEFLNKTYTESYKAAWVEELGHAIIDSVDLHIGGGQIDRQTGDWLIVWNHLTLGRYQIENYDKMIGNVPELITFDDKGKPRYKLIIPLQFWFCRYHGLALPLVSLRYPDIILNMQLKDLKYVFYFEDTPNLLDTANVQSTYNIHLQNVTLYCDYVYLDSDERRRFAQAAHEYLIEQVQLDTFTDLQGKKFHARCNFAQPCKYFIWYAQPNQYRDNPTGRNKCQWNNFGVNPDRSGYSLAESAIIFNSSFRMSPSPAIYFNYVQPWQNFTRSPTDGLNVYSFSLIPEEQQPASSVNTSRLAHVGLNVEFTPELQALADSNKISGILNGIYLAAFAVNYNILRFMSGMAGLAFQLSA